MPGTTGKRGRSWKGKESLERIPLQGETTGRTMGSASGLVRLPGEHRENQAKGSHCFGEPRTGGSGPCDGGMADLGAKAAAAVLRKVSHNNPSPSSAEGELSRHQEGAA